MTSEEKEIFIKGIEEKRAELEKKLSVKVHAYYFDTDEFGFVIGYFREPDRYSKRKCLDLIKIGQFSQASEMLLGVCLIKEESSPYITSEDQKYDEIVLGFENKVQELVKFYVSAEKKS